MEKNTSEMILQKLLQIELEFGQEFKDIKSEIKEIRQEAKDNRDGIIEAITFVGDRVFGNHERRIQTIEEKLD